MDDSASLGGHFLFLHFAFLYFLTNDVGLRHLFLFYHFDWLLAIFFLLILRLISVLVIIDILKIGIVHILVVIVVVHCPKRCLT